MIDQNQLIQYGHPSEVRDFQALSPDKLYLDRFNNTQQYSDWIVKYNAILQRQVSMLKFIETQLRRINPFHGHP